MTRRCESRRTRRRVHHRLDRQKLKQIRRREGRYLLRTNLTETDPVKLWNYYLQLVQVEEAFRTLKSWGCTSGPSITYRRRTVESAKFG